MMFLLRFFLPCMLSMRPLCADRDFLGQRAATVDFEELERDMREAVDALGGAAKVEKILWRTFAALPKNEFGRVAPPAVRYAVRSYFLKQHGWLIDGLGSSGIHFNSTGQHEASIMAERVPAYVEDMLEQKRSGHGLALNDLVVMVMVLERLILESDVESINDAFRVSGVSPSSRVDQDMLLWVHKMWTAGNSVSFSSAEYMNTTSELVTEGFKEKLEAKKTKVMDTRYDAVFNYAYAHRHVTNPFISHAYSSAASLEIAHEWTRDDIHRCHEMKAHLVELDPRGSGRVPLSTFHAQKGRSHGFDFGESADYLRSIGVLDESDGSPQVLIPNYVASPANCNRHTAYYSACCTTGCEDVIHEIEGMVLAPEASPELLVSISGNISTASVEAPRLIPYTLVEKLHSVATLHGGVVPLHGRLFSQWLHFAFPSECPHPNSYVSSSVRNQWLDFESAHASVSVPKEERLRQANASQAHMFASERSISQWTDHEVLPLVHTQSRSCWHQLSQVTAVLAIFFATAKAGTAAWWSVADNGHATCSKEKWAHYV